MIAATYYGILIQTAMTALVAFITVLCIFFAIDITCTPYEEEFLFVKLVKHLWRNIKELFG